MGRPRKVLSKPNRDARTLVGENLTRIIKREFPGKSPNFAYQKIAAATGASPSSIKRIVAGNVATTVDTLSNIAYCLGVELSELTTHHTVIATAPQRTELRRPLALQPSTATGEPPTE